MIRVWWKKRKKGFRVGPTIETIEEQEQATFTDGSVPNALVIATCDVVKSKVAAAEHISQFNEEARSPFVKKHKTIIHPGEVNRIRELPQNKNIVATHTDCPEVPIWDIEAQPNRYASLGAGASHSDLVLTGHVDNAELVGVSSDDYHELKKSYEIIVSVSVV
ncbi:hypothetical protein L1887_18375 [Cichorium endivia]|nr:hypothetical protein L1887_18375 [Cichorium endivia]